MKGEIHGTERIKKYNIFDSRTDQPYIKEVKLNTRL